MRTNEEYRKNDGLDALLKHLNEALQRGEAATCQEFHRPRLPVVFVIGAPRSGTTLLMQWLAGSGQFCYPTNLMSRFYGAPYIGSLIQRMLLDPALQYRREFRELHNSVPNFESFLGKTSGIREPNEFWYFWRRFFPVDVPRPLATVEGNIEPQGFAQGLAAIESVFELPFAAKGMALQYDLDVLSDALDEVIFVYTRRSFAHNVESLLRVREKLHGDHHTWYSAKPAEYDQLRQYDPLMQVVGQVELTNRALMRQLQSNRYRVVEVDYEAFCQSPQQTRDLLTQQFASCGHDLDASQWPDDSFLVQNAKLTQQRVAEIEACRQNILDAFPQPQ